MPYDSQGNFTRVMNWQEDAANSVPIVASRHDDEDDNFAQGFNETLCRDGRAQMTGNLKMGNYKITGLADGTADNDAVNKSQLDAVSTAVLDTNNAWTGNNSFSGTTTAVTQAVGDNSNKIATDAFVQNEFGNKIKLVNSLPVSPVATTLYCIPEQ